MKKNNNVKSLPSSRFFYYKQSFLDFQKETPRCTCKASFTLEAAVIVPLLACFFVSLLFFFRVMQVQLEMQQALDATSRALAVYAEVEDTVTEDSALLGVFNIGLAKTVLDKKLSEQQYAPEWIQGGYTGINLLTSNVSGDDIDLVAIYEISLPVNLPVPYTFKVIQRSCSRKWTGWKATEEEEDAWVYITETGSVYHTTKSCSYLELSIESVFFSNIGEYRSKSGAKYYACPLCVEEDMSLKKVYITNYGNRYHSDLNCSGIKRTIYQVKLSEVGDKKACSKCGSGGS